MKKKSLVLIIMLLLVGLTSGYVASTYAKYTSKVEGSKATATVAQWAFATDNASQTIAVSLDKTYDPDTLVAGKIAPGTSGSFNIAVSNANSEVGVDATIEMDYDYAKLPTNLKFYSDENHQNEIETDGYTVTLAPHAASQNVTIYWAWAYETSNGDAADTTDGEAHESLEIPVTITGVQVQPE